MTFLQSLLYGLISGLAAFLPISSRGHQLLMKQVFGINTPTPVADIFIHIAVIFAVFFSCRTYINKILRYTRSDNKRNAADKQMDRSIRFDLRLIRGSILPLVIIMALYLITKNFFNSMLLTALLFILNGVIVYLPEHMAHGNKDAGKLSAFDGILLGSARALSVFPGLSGVGAAISCSVARGADVQKSLNWIFIISIPASVCMIVLEMIGIFITGIGVMTFSVFLGYLIAAIIAFAAALIGIYVMRFIAGHSGFSGFGFYSWGAALLAFILYLTA